MVTAKHVVSLYACFSVGTSVLLCVYLKVTEDGDVGKFFAISMRIEGEQERPLQTHEAPHTWQVQTGRICEGFFVGDGNTEEGDERYDGYHGENDAYDQEELQSL